MNSKMNKIKINNFYLNVIDNDWMGLNMSAGNLWEPHITQFLIYELKSDSIFVDVGSNYGYHSIFASKLCEKIYSFEPQEIMFELQKESILDNNFSNIELKKIALGNENKKVKLTSFESSNVNVNVGEVSVIINDEDEENDIVMMKMDDVINNKVDVIKIDVQGFEKFVLDGAKTTISNYKPHLVVEFENHQLGKFGYNSEELFKYIKDLDYHLFLLDYHYPSDFACIHSSKLDDFIRRNNKYVFNIEENNGLNYCLDSKINQKLVYSYEVSSNTIKNFFFE